MKRLLSFILSLLFVTACTQKSAECVCYQGIGSDSGDKPIQTFTFSNNKSVSVCGYDGDELISEFNVFDCENGESLVEYGALKKCTISFENDKVIITQMLYLPNNDAWELEYVPFAQETIAAEGDKLKVEPRKPLTFTSNISGQVQDDFLNLFEPLNLQSEDITEELLLKLEALALTGKEKAVLILKEIGNTYPLDGAVHETFNWSMEHIEFQNQQQ
jgi:hypothetical protein